MANQFTEDFKRFLEQQLGISLDSIEAATIDPVTKQSLQSEVATKNLQTLISASQLAGLMAENRTKFIDGAAKFLSPDAIKNMGDDAPTALCRALEEFQTVVANRKKAEAELEKARAEAHAIAQKYADALRLVGIGEGTGLKSFTEVAKDGSLKERLDRLETLPDANLTPADIGQLADSGTKLVQLEQANATYDANVAKIKADATKTSAEAAATRPLEDIAADIKAGRKVSTPEWMALKNAEKLTYDTELTRQNEINAEYQNQFNQIGLNILNGGHIDLRGAMQRSWNGSPGAGIDMGGLMQGALNGGGSPDVTGRAAMKNIGIADAAPASHRRVAPGPAPHREPGSGGD
jgi:hypothetical protein